MISRNLTATRTTQQHYSLSYLKTILANAWRTYGRILDLIRPHWIPSLGAVVSLLLSNTFALTVPALLAWVVDNGLKTGRTQDLLLAAGAVLVVELPARPLRLLARLSLAGGLGAGRL